MAFETRRKTLLGLIGFFFVIWFLLPLVFPPLAGPIFLVTLPVRYLGIFVHEMGHGFASLLTGGRFHWFQMDLSSGGVAITSGGFRLITVLGGLLGPAVAGALLMVASTRRAWVKPACYTLFALFIVGIYYMIKPLFMGRGVTAGDAPWHVGYLAALVVPMAGLALTWVILKKGHGTQTVFIQVMAILMCFSAFNSNAYIFRYERLDNGLQSDAMVVASSFWPGLAPYWWFLLVATVIAGLNMGLMVFGTARALRRPEKVLGATARGTAETEVRSKWLS